MNWKLHLISLFAVVSAAAACGSPEPGKSAISTDKNQITMVEGGGAQLVKVAANSSWSVTSNADWLSVTPSGGDGNATVTVEATVNKGDARTATLNFGTTDGSSSCPVTVSQSAGRPDTPDTPDVPAGYSSIADLRKMYMGSDVTVSKDIKVKGTVISDYRNADNGGLNNNTSLKALVIADETAGIFLYCASDNTSFLQGDEVEVSLKGQTLSRYQGGPLQVNGIPLSKVTKVGDGKMPAPLEITAKQFLSGDYESRYVAVKDVQVSSADLGKSFVMNGAHTSISVETGDGDSFDIFSSKYSSYGATAVPEGSGTICGIGSVYGERYQIVFAKKSDWEGLTGERFAAGAIFTLKSTSYSTSGESGTARISLISTV
ncbi:MAG: BACON domain-containing protein, partial [Bacteroidales bacterium]|nr:BACON domain-containing protein [Bacteroidales bacterium]